MKKALLIVMVVLLAFSIVSCGNRSGRDFVPGQGTTVQDEYRFVMIPFLAQAWFDILYDAAREMADHLGQMTGTRIVIDYQATPVADIVLQSELLERAIATNPDGIAISLIDVETQLPLVQEAKRRGIPVILFINVAPPGSGIPYIGNDFYEQGWVQGVELMRRINYRGTVAILHGIPTSDPHVHRYNALRNVIAQHPNVDLVSVVFDYDDIEIAAREASAILAAHPNLTGFGVVNAAGPVGVGIALRESGRRPGDVVYVGIDDLPQLQELMIDGWLDLSIATMPNQIGRWCVISLFLERNGVPPITNYDTKAAWLTPDMLRGGVIKGF
jgi:ribose transport system substrate-binding protein